MTCSICFNEIPAEHDGRWTQGHNAEPVNSGRCCGSCNSLVVIPARLSIMVGHDKDA
jgi:putative lipase involved disintegration of autophagic bodies